MLSFSKALSCQRGNDMSKLFVLLLMIFCHIVDDYYLQGILANLKQKKWWKNNAPDKLYKFDWIVALILHSFSWSFLIMLPVALYLRFDVGLVFLMVLSVNTAIHAIVDHLKANLFIINLITDQSIHIFQIFVTAAIFIL